MKQVLLGCVLNHPAMFERAEEELGRLHITEQRLDLLRQAILSYLSENPEASRENMLTGLSEQGFQSEMRGVLCESVYTHAAFIRPQAEIEDVQKGWDQAINMLYQEDKRQQL